jgi:hypothetical protein
MRLKKCGKKACVTNNRERKLQRKITRTKKRARKKEWEGGKKLSTESQFCLVRFGTACKCSLLMEY